MARRLSDTEALLWSMEHHPSLSSTMGSILLLDGAPDPERVRRTIAYTVASVPRLRERVVEPLIRVAPPEWVEDDQFDLDHHLRFLRLRPRATMADLEAFAAQTINDPFDRGRPLWQWTIVTGLRGGRAAVVSKMHHSIADGAGALQMGAHVFDFVSDAPTKPELAWPTPEPEPQREPEPDRRVDGLRAGADRLVALLNDAAGVIADPGRIGNAGSDALAAARNLAGQLPGAGRHGSPTWAARSRNRRLFFVDGALDQLRDAARARELSVNDVFVAALAEAAVRYHDAVAADLDRIRMTVVVSTRNEGDAAEHNAFLPVALELPGAASEVEERAVAARAQVAAARQSLAGTGGDPLGVISSVAGLVPSALTAAFAVDQASRVDFATSNLPGPPVDVWFAGQAIEHLRPIGPVSGTAFNATLLSYGGRFSIGVHLDPAAITDQPLLRRSVRDGFTAFDVTTS